MNLPPCPNHTEGRCPRSDVRIERETDTVFTFRCQTCGCANIFPKNSAEDKGRYDAYLQSVKRQQDAEAAHDRRTRYST